MFLMLLMIGTYDQIFNYAKIEDPYLSDYEIENSLVEFCYHGERYRYCNDLSDSVDLGRISDMNND